MLMRWKQNTGAHATYQALRDALQHKLVHRHDLIEKICYFRGNYLYNILLFPALLSILESGQHSLGWSKRLVSLCFVLTVSFIYSLNVSHRSLTSGNERGFQGIHHFIVKMRQIKSRSHLRN